MSNQVYSNSLSRYSPSAYQTDKLSLTANNAAVPNVSPAYGNVLKNVPGTGNGVFWGTLNGVAAPTVGTAVIYSAAQNPNTNQFWSISADTAVLGGATLLRAKINCVVQVNAVVPMDFPNVEATAQTLALAIRVYNADNSIDRTVAYNGIQKGVYTGGIAATAPIPFSVSAAIGLRSGQALSVIMLVSTTAWNAVGLVVDYKDFLAPQTVVAPPLTSQVQMPCICEFTKL